ncbi:MAG: hypothetical protein OQK79_06800 [Rhodanobacter sp.]|jgi:hypothetical protein|nr:hypothetical protein [Rhodanobacter sp.]
MSARRDARLPASAPATADRDLDHRQRHSASQWVAITVIKTLAVMAMIGAYYLTGIV